MTEQAILPESMEGNTLGTMMVGDCYYTTPWAMRVDRNRRCWLHPSYPAELEANGTVRMLVALQEDGYHVYPPADYKYLLTGEDTFYGDECLNFIPVVKLHTKN